MGGQKKTLNNNAPLTPDQEPSIDLADVLSASVTTETIETVENVAEVTMAEEEFVITPEEPTASKETVAPQETLSEDSLEDVPITEEDVSLKIDTTATSVQGDAYADPSVSLPLTPALSQDSNATASGLDPVPGFQLVEAKGLTDTSAPDIPKSVLPERATASPIVKPPTSPMPSMDRFGSPSKPPPPPPKSQEDLMNPLSDMPKSKRFSQRMDYMITEFFSTVFQQKIKERLGAHWAHVTAQPEVDSAIAEIDSMWDLFEKMERMVERQRAALMHLTDVEAEVSLHFQQLGFQDPESLTRDHLVDLGITYHEICKKRQVLVLAIDTFLHFVKNFRTKAIQDSVDTKNRQIGARQELDSYGSKLGQLEERKLKSYARSSSSGSSTPDFSNPMEKELELTRLKFHEVKTRYTTYSTQVIDKAGLLKLKLSVDFALQLETLNKAYKAYYHFSDVDETEEDAEKKFTSEESSQQPTSA